MESKIFPQISSTGKILSSHEGNVPQADRGRWVGDKQEGGRGGRSFYT